MQKNKIIIIVLIVIAVIGISIFFYYQSNRGGETPEDAAVQFLINIAHGKHDQARRYLANETSKQYDESRLETINKAFSGDGKAASYESDDITFSADGKSAVGRYLIIGGGERMKSIPVTFTKTMFGWTISNIKI